MSRADLVAKLKANGHDVDKMMVPAAAPTTAPPAPVTPTTHTPLAQSQSVGDLIMQTPEAINDLVRGMARGVTGGRINDWAARLSPGDYQTNLAAQEAADTASKRSGFAGLSEFGGAAIPSILIGAGAGSALEAASPTIARSLPAVAPYMERTVNAMKTAGLSLGEANATASGVIPWIKNALINAGIRSSAGASTNALAAQLTAPNDVGTATLVGGALPFAGAFTKVPAFVVSKIVDRVKSFNGTIPAGKIIRDALAEQFQPALDALRNAPNDGRTAVQVLMDAGVPDVPAFAALTKLTMKASPSTAFKTITDAQEATHRQVLSTLSGGTTQTETRAATEAAREGVNRTTTPMRNDVLSLTQEGNQIPVLEAEAATHRTAAEQAVEDVRRLHTATEKASALGTPRGAALANVGENAQETAAAYSRAYGRDAKAAEAAAQAIRDKGLSPLKPDALIDDINNTLKDPTFAGDAPLEAALKSVANSVRKWTDNGMGTIDGNALYGIRKFAVSDAIRTAMPGASESAVQGAMVRALVPINKAIDRAIEAASGNTGAWSKYLSTHTELMHGVEQQQLAAIAQDLYRAGNKKAFVDLIQGNNTKAVEDVFGPGKHDIAVEMGAMYPDLKRVADQIARDLKISANAEEGTTAARNVINDRTQGITNWPRVGKGLRVSGSAQDLFDAALSRNTQKVLYDALQSGQGAAAVLDKLSAAERAKLTGLFGGRTGILKYLDSVFTGVSGGTAASAQTPAKRKPRNAMSTPNQNAMAR